MRGEVVGVGSGDEQEDGESGAGDGLEEDVERAVGEAGWEGEIEG